MADDYYEREELVVSWRYEIAWKKSDPRAREDALRLARRGTQDGGAAGLHGCYGARRLGVVSEADPRRVLAEEMMAGVVAAAGVPGCTYMGARPLTRDMILQVCRLALGRPEPKEG